MTEQRLAVEDQELLFHYAGDLWTELENLREHWDPTRVHLIEQYIERFEKAAGIGGDQDREHGR